MPRTTQFGYSFASSPHDSDVTKSTDQTSFTFELLNAFYLRLERRFHSHVKQILMKLGEVRVPASRIEMGDRTAVETTGRPPGRRKKLAGHRGVSHSHIMASLSRVLGSRAFDGSKSLKLLLKHLLMKLLCSEADQIKEYSLGVDVFNRRETFDPRLDSIVRVQARRLRQKLKEYYNTEGRNETIRIYLPKGCYIPVIYTHSPVDLPCGPNSKRCRIAVLPFAT